MKIVNPSASAVTTQLTFTGKTGTTAKIEVLANADDTVGNTLTASDAITPTRSTLTGSGGAFGYTAPANSLTVVTVERR